MLSELIIAATLVVNGFAVLNFNLKKTESGFDIDTNSDSLGNKIRNFLISLQYFRKFSNSFPSGRKNIARLRANSHDQNLNDDDELSIDFSKKIRELRLELEIKKCEEERIEKDIAIILEENTMDGGEQNRSFGLALTRLNNKMLVVENSAKQLTHSLKNVSTLADTISGRVSALDTAKTRVVSCLQLASDMRDLHTSAEGIDDAIRTEDFETAAQHINRFLTLDKAVFQIREFKDKDATDSIRHSYDVLTLAKERLSKILKAKLDDAVKRTDVAEMQRFVKLFPLLNEPDEGLQRFGVYLNQKIDKLANENFTIMKAGGTDDNRRNVLYADTLFMFFEGIADIIETNLPIIENAYGLGKLLDFMFILQTRIDDFFTRVMAEFEKHRNVKSLIKQVSFLNSNEEFAEKQPDSNDIDVVLSEICMMNMHVEMYWRFIGRRVGKNSKEEASEEKTPEDLEKIEEQKKKQKEEKEKKLDQLLNRSELGTRMQELIGSYILLEQYYMQKSAEKAIDMDQKEEDSLLTSSITDDVVFIIRKCIRRAAGSGNVDSVCATINNAVALLDTTVHNYLAQNIQADYSNFGFATDAIQSAQTAYNAYQQGKTVKDTHDSQRDAFLLAINNTTKLASLLKDLQRGLDSEWSGKQRPQVEKNKLEHSTTLIDEAARKLSLLSKHGIEELFKATFKPKIKNACAQYREISHQLSMEDLEHFEANDPFMESFLALIDKMIAEHQPLLHSDNFQTLLLTICTEVSRQFELYIFKCQFNRYGTLQLDREFRQLTAYLTNVAGWNARERCSRLGQIVSLLNVETVDEAVEIWQNSKSGPSAAAIRPLTLPEFKKVLSLRIDFPSSSLKFLDL
ncbi:unnamed protein product [Caenorhabditis bovis]|uniref:Conserved oligomeric Golgi complex subunit 4 n=1 Tax=Caenorhabditis bovis TaxID=2654633 RepID=A0A8S1EYB3_9PELO|nr:unnamed protein product [Caenorhabditis bovis]